MKELRTYDFSREEMRAFAPKVAEEGSRYITGYAIVFNQQSRVLYDSDKKRTFVERIDPSAVSREFLDNQDIKLLFNHDSNHLLGRSVYGGGSMTYDIDEYGVRYTCEMPDTTDGNDVLELIRRGDIFGCSFAFYYDKEGVRDERIDGIFQRTVSKFSAITDFSVVVDPAYFGTAVTARAFEEPEPEPEPEPKLEPEPEPEPAPEPDEPRGFSAAEELELFKLKNLSI